jgi:hypothetical protein
MQRLGSKSFDMLVYWSRLLSYDMRRSRRLGAIVICDVRALSGESKSVFFRVFEKAMHIFFKDVRVYKRKEFFVLTIADVNRVFDLVTGKKEDDKFKDEWKLAFRKAIQKS